MRSSEIQSVLTMEEDGLYWYEILNCVFNAWISYTAIILNSLTIHAIRKTPSLPKPFKTLLLSLSVSDLGVGLVAQPLNITSFVMEYLERNTENHPTLNIIHKVYLVAVNLFFFASFFGVTALSTDRFLAIHLHLRYQELVTHERLVAVVISIWVVSASLSLVGLFIPINVVYVIFAIIEILCLVTATLLNYKIYMAARRHAGQTHIFQVRQETQDTTMANVERVKKYVIATVYVYLVFLVCYLPDICILWIIAITTKPQDSVFIVQNFTVTLLLLNSSLNPVVYCLKMRHIRHAVIEILRKIKQISGLWR